MRKVALRSPAFLSEAQVISVPVKATFMDFSSAAMVRTETVSYTHLTLPTNREV